MIALQAVAQTAAQTASQSTSPTGGIRDLLLSFLGGGLVAAIITIVFGVCWDIKKQKMDEEWEYRRYQANQIHFATVALTEIFFSVKTELLFLTAMLELLLANLNRLTEQADAIVRNQGPALTAAELEQRKKQLLEPFQKFNDEQVRLRWYHYEQKTKELQSRAETQVVILSSLVSAKVREHIEVIYAKLTTSWQWDLPHAKERLTLYENHLPEFTKVRKELAQEIDTKLGRTK